MTTSCWLYATAYSIYSQLASTLEVVPQTATRGRAMPWWQGPIIPKILFGIRRRKSGRSRLLYLFIRTVIKQIGVNTEAYHFFQVRTKFYPTSCSQCSLHIQRKLSGIISVDTDATGQLLIIHSAFIKYSRKNWNTMEKCISYLWSLRNPKILLGGRYCIIFCLSLVYH